MLGQLKVNDLMTKSVISAQPDSKLSTAKALMKEFGIRHLPVVEHGVLVGIISSGDIREAAPSDATTLSIWELNYLWDKITVGEVMTRNVVSIEADDLFIDALRIMVARKFSSLPVVRQDALVGILTETDVFHKIIALAEAEMVQA